MINSEGRGIPRRMFGGILFACLLVMASCSSSSTADGGTAADEDASGESTEADGSTGESDPEQAESATGDGSVLDQVLARGTLRVGVTGDYLPFSYPDSDGGPDLEGIDIEMAQRLADSLGVELEIVQTTWPTLMEDLQASEYDIAMGGITIKLERQQEALFSEPVVSSGKLPITRDENVEEYDTIEEINQEGVRVIFNPGGTNEDFAKENFPNAEHITEEDNLSIFGKLVDGEADVFVTDGIEAVLQQELQPELEAVNPDSPFNSFELGYMMRRDHTFKEYVDQWLEQERKEGNFVSIFDAYDAVYDAEVDELVEEAAAA